jgi:hypothetical protein
MNADDLGRTVLQAFWTAFILGLLGVIAVVVF